MLVVGGDGFGVLLFFGLLSLSCLGFFFRFDLLSPDGFLAKD